MSKTLLLADDSVVIQKLVGLSFANEDVEIIATDNGDDAIARAREVNPDVVLADVVMPGKSGYEVCEAIKQDPDLAHVPVLLLTGTFEAFDEDRAAAAGANGQITKPFEAQSLVERVNAVMREASAAPVVMPEPASTPETAIENPASSGISLGSFGGSAASAAGSPTASTSPTPSANFENASAAISDEAPGYGRRVTDDEASKVGRDASESDFFENQLTPQLNADQIDDEFTADLAGRHDGDDDVLLSSPGLEISQDLAADFSDSPLAAYAGPASSTPHVADNSFDDQADTIVSLPPMSPARGYGAYADSSTAASGESAMDDGLEMGDPMPLPDALTTPLPGDLEMDLVVTADANTESQRRLADATILVGQDDVNASTFPSYAIPMDESDGSDGEPIAGVFAESVSSSNLNDALTVHEPSARIDQDAAFAPSPAAPSAYVGQDVGQPSGVADLDASLNRDTQEALHIGPPRPDSYAEPAANTLPSEPDPLNVGPTSLAGEDLDFAFDVSEQREVSAADVLSEEAAMDMEMDDVSESQLIGRDTSERVTPVASADDALVGDYDVSSSDLATAASDVSSEASPLNSGEASRPHSGEASPPNMDVDENDTSFSSPLVEPFSSGHYAVGLDSAPSRGQQENDRGDSESRSASSAFGSSSASSHPSFAPEPTQTGADDAEIDLGSQRGDDRRISDLSPMMEQRIQETLEKVAWEAFSDLSETIVKQVISRVEQVAWDVIPEMAETLVREEIRRMKGEED